jgi:hypothetical protein
MNLWLTSNTSKPFNFNVLFEVYSGALYVYGLMPIRKFCGHSTLETTWQVTFTNLRWSFQQEAGLDRSLQPRGRFCGTSASDIDCQ